MTGRVHDYGESPKKRARLALEGFTWGRPSTPTAADLAGLDEVMVATEPVMSQQAADLAPGDAVEYRSREPYLIGGWFRAKVLQVPWLFLPFWVTGLLSTFPRWQKYQMNLVCARAAAQKPHV